MNQSRDTPCAACYKWTHRLTPGGTGLIFCDRYCALRYDQRHGTHHAFDRYHFIPIGGQIFFNSNSEDLCWMGLASWISDYYNRRSVDYAKEHFEITERSPKRTAFRCMKPY